MDARGETTRRHLSLPRLKPDRDVVTETEKRKEKYPAKAHLRATVRYLARPLRSEFLFLAGSRTIPIGSSDQAYEFIQESSFYYLTGSTEPDWFLVYDLSKEESTLYVPPLRTGREIVYLGQRKSVEEVKEEYEVDWVFYHDEGLARVVSQMPAGLFYTLASMSSSIDDRGVEGDLARAVVRARSIKDDHEVSLITRANDISSAAHLAILTNLSRFRSEREAEAEFLTSSRLQGGGRQAYHPIVAAGSHASILHYGANDAPFQKTSKSTEMTAARKIPELLLVDAAATFGGYAADVTRTYPIHGTFSPLARRLYSLVLDIQSTCIDLLKPGVTLATLTKRAHDSVARFMVEQGWVSCSLETCRERQLSLAFFMHGIGHHIGLDVHDVTPAVESSPSATANFDGKSSNCSLATSMGHLRAADLQELAGPEAASLEEGNVVTIEPGIYFNMEYLETFYHGPLGHFYNQEAIRPWYSLGGIRIEDCLLLTKHGSKNLTSMEKSIEGIERLYRK